ncbi:MAG: hypothetical protein AB4050_20045 [Synechococcus sp.]
MPTPPLPFTTAITLGDAGWFTAARDFPRLDFVCDGCFDDDDLADDFDDDFDCAR